jgi:hypothetical protein
MRSATVRLALVPLFAAIVLTWPGTSPGADDAGKPAATSPSTQSSEGGPSKFYGTITAIDAKAKTFTIDKQTFTIAADSHLTKAADDSPATIADVVVGEPARGTYTKSSDGTLTVTKVRFGKKSGGSGGGKKGKAAAAATQKSE